MKDWCPHFFGNDSHILGCLCLQCDWPMWVGRGGAFPVNCCLYLDVPGNFLKGYLEVLGISHFFIYYTHIFMPISGPFDFQES